MNILCLENIFIITKPEKIVTQQHLWFKMYNSNLYCLFSLIKLFTSVAQLARSFKYIPRRLSAKKKINDRMKELCKSSFNYLLKKMFSKITLLSQTIFYLIFSQ